MDDSKITRQHWKVMFISGMGFLPMRAYDGRPVFLCSTAELWRRMVRAIHPNGTENEGGGQRFRYFAVDGLSGAALCEMQTLQRSR